MKKGIIRTSGDHQKLFQEVCPSWVELQRPDEEIDWSLSIIALKLWAKIYRNPDISPALLKKWFKFSLIFGEGNPSPMEFVESLDSAFSRFMPKEVDKEVENLG